MMTNVTITTPTSQCSFSRCHVDEFEPGVLTVTSVDDGSAFPTFLPGTWTRAVATRHDGYPEYWFIAGEEGKKS